MSKKILSLGGAALCLTALLALIGCPGAGDSTPPKPAVSIASVAVMENAVLVTYNQSLADVNQVMGTDFATTTDNYIVSKGGTDQKIGTVTEVNTIANTVKLEVTGIHSQLNLGDKITVTVKQVGSIDYTVDAPKLVSAKAISPTEIQLTFNDGIKTIGTIAPSQFVIKGSNIGSPTTTAVAPDANNPLVYNVTANGMKLTNTVIDTVITYTTDNANKLAGVNGIDVASFTDKPVDTTSLKPLPLTATIGKDNDATKLTLEFSEPLHDNAGKALSQGDVARYFDKTGTDKISSANLDADLKTVTFALAGSADGDAITSTTITTAHKVPWKEQVTFDKSKWAIKTPRP